MKIIVCMKQVPAGKGIEIHPETGALKEQVVVREPIRMIYLPLKQPYKSVQLSVVRSPF